MSPVKTRTLVYGPDAVRAASALRIQQSKDSLWPYDWEFGAPGSKHDQANDYAVVPAANTPTEVVAYQVADGLDFYPQSLVLALIGTSFAPGDFTWSLTVNSPVGVTAAQALPYDGFQNVPFPLGTLERPWDFAPGERNILRSRDVLRIVVNNLNLGQGSGAFVGVIRGRVIPAAR